MKPSAIVFNLSFAVTALSAAIKRGSPIQAHGVDVVDNQTSIDFAALAAAGNQFVYVWNSEDWPGRAADAMARAVKAGLVAGVYHIPVVGSTRYLREAQDDGKALAHETPYDRSGKYVPSAMTLTGDCWAELGPQGTVQYLSLFAQGFYSVDQRYPVLRTTAAWWKVCTANDATLGATASLWLFDDSGSQTLCSNAPAGWSAYTFCSPGGNLTYSDSRSIRFNGELASLVKYARENQTSTAA